MKTSVVSSSQQDTTTNNEKDNPMQPTPITEHSRPTNRPEPSYLPGFDKRC